jgi:hypothetical protein
MDSYSIHRFDRKSVPVPNTVCCHLSLFSFCLIIVLLCAGHPPGDQGRGGGAAAGGQGQEDTLQLGSVFALASLNQIMIINQ